MYVVSDWVKGNVGNMSFGYWNVIICYHKCREAVAARVNRIAKDGTATNSVDLFT